MLYFAGKISLTISGMFNLPKTNSQEDVDAAERANQFDVSLPDILYFLSKASVLLIN